MHTRTGWVDQASGACYFLLTDTLVLCLVWISWNSVLGFYNQISTWFCCGLDGMPKDITQVVFLLASLGGLLTLLGMPSLSMAGREPAYLTSDRCAQCHREAYDAWSDSHHGWAWRLATPKNVLGDFAGATFEHRGVHTRFFTRESRFYVETNGPDNRPATYEITWTVGVSPLQQYLVSLKDGRLQALDITWDSVQGRWFHLYPDQALNNDRGLHWSAPYKSWNARCVNCHVTDFRKGYQPLTHRYQSTWSETGVGCEACHGPGKPLLHGRKTQKPQQ
jgi:hypothetical protein